MYIIVCLVNKWQCVIYYFRVEVLATLTSDVGRILSKLHQVQPNGEINLHTGIRIAHVRVISHYNQSYKL